VEIELSGATDPEMSEAEKRADVVRLAFDAIPVKLDVFRPAHQKLIP
jgi:hypothetical protein